ncbi:BTAD domain-containing putative transcriptional regulator [Geodermatophilus maliterrae]|uniref:BTAD domain-containing putative transcriptional regulator n=1 Tax=Geodermatophilus maliterrae TaxID=3162531 RepID=A0ABV3XAL5_9ACTN
MAGGGGPRVRVEVLGPLRLLVGGEAVDVRGPKRRAVLALLAVAEGRVVPVDHLVDALWPAEVPESGRQALHSHVSRLRAHLGPAAVRLETWQEGYRLALGQDELDLAEARALLAAAREGGAREPAAAYTLLRRVHAIWRGPLLADLTEVAPVAAAVEECARLRCEVTDALVAAAIAAGEAGSVVDLATASVAEAPLREPAVLLLMRALAATGRAPEALETGRRYRSRLAEEAGLDPSPALAGLERGIAGGAAGPASPRHEVPVRPTTRLFGREAQAAALHRLLAGERLVTLVGPGGVGKTRLAEEVVRGDRSATVLLLGPVTDPAAVPHALAAALDLDVVQGDVLAACLAVLGDRPGLLVVDNCEHLLDVARDTVGRLLSACPRLSVLATSREPLGLAAEHTFRLAPLPLPGPGQDLARVPSVALFLDRADRVRSGPPLPRADLRTVADVVTRLDGMPLAIELAARRLSTFSLADLRDRLDRSLDLLGGAGPSGDPRHRTLRATVEWSHRLLAGEEQRLFRHLAVFVDGFSLDTAEWLAADLGLDGDPGSVLARLVDASMVIADLQGGPRYRLLETLRAFGLDRLTAAGEDGAATGRLLRWAVELTGWIGATMRTEHEPRADAVLRRELPNLRAAWRLARSRGSLDAAAAVITALFETVGYRDLVEVRGWAEELAGDPATATHPRAAAVLGTAAEAAYHRGDHPRAERLARTGLDLATDDAGRWQCLLPLSVVALARGAYAEAVEHSLAAAVTGAGRHRENLGIAALASAYAGDLDRARTLNARGLDDAVSPSMVGWGHYVAGEIENRAGHLGPAAQHYLRAVELCRASGATFLVGVATVGLVTARAGAGHVREALSGYREVVDYFARTGNWTHQWTTLRNLADLLRRLGDPEPAALIDAAADRAPDAPAVGRGAPVAPAPPGRPVPGRTAVLEVARAAIERNLA